MGRIQLVFCHYTHGEGRPYDPVSHFLPYSFPTSQTSLKGFSGDVKSTHTMLPQILSVTEFLHRLSVAVGNEWKNNNANCKHITS